MDVDRLSRGSEAEKGRPGTMADHPLPPGRGATGPDDLSEVTTPAERIAMMWVLAEAAWKVAGRPWPTYDRRNIPARFFRPGTRPPDDYDA